MCPQRKAFLNNLFALPIEKRFFLQMWNYLFTFRALDVRFCPSVSEFSFNILLSWMFPQRKVSSDVSMYYRHRWVWLKVDIVVERDYWETLRIRSNLHTFGPSYHTFSHVVTSYDTWLCVRVTYCRIMWQFVTFCHVLVSHDRAAAAGHSTLLSVRPCCLLDNSSPAKNSKISNYKAHDEKVFNTFKLALLLSQTLYYIGFRIHQFSV